MNYKNMRKGRFISRPNRFIAHIALDGDGIVVCHVKNTGRCKELLVPDATVYVQECDKAERKTKFDLIAVKKSLVERTGKHILVNMDAQAPNAVFREWAEAGYFLPNLTLLRPETKWGNSRFDFYWESEGGRRGFVEVKGVTLEENGHARFPDAPTERGVKHLEELIACQSEGFEAAVCFVIQMEGIRSFSPNDSTHPAFGDALRRAHLAGVNIMARGCAVTSDSLNMAGEIPVFLSND